MTLVVVIPFDGLVLDELDSILLFLLLCVLNSGINSISVEAIGEHRIRTSVR